LKSLAVSCREFSTIRKFVIFGFPKIDELVKGVLRTTFSETFEKLLLKQFRICPLTWAVRFAQMDAPKSS
jgi:hypothetical protein